jgi:hypothetical protein
MSRLQRSVVLLVLTAVAVGSLVPTGAAPAETVVSGPEGEHSIVVNPVSPHATIDDGGQLELRLDDSIDEAEGEGFNPNSRYSYDALFRLRYEGTESTNLWITTDSDAVTFVGPDGGRIDSLENAIRLEENESVTVGLTVNVSDDGDGGVRALEDITIHAQLPTPTSDDGSLNVDPGSETSGEPTPTPTPDDGSLNADPGLETSGEPTPTPTPTATRDSTASPSLSPTSADDPGADAEATPTTVAITATDTGTTARTTGPIQEPAGFNLELVAAVLAVVLFLLAWRRRRNDEE